MLSLGRSHAIAKHTGFRGFLWVGSSCWEAVSLFHCKSCAFSRLIEAALLPNTLVSEVFCIMMMGKSDFLSLQEPFVSWRPLPKGWGGLFGGVSLIGGLFGGLAAGLVGGLGGCCALCF